MPRDFFKKKKTEDDDVKPDLQPVEAPQSEVSSAITPRPIEPDPTPALPEEHVDVYGGGPDGPVAPPPPTLAQAVTPQPVETAVQGYGQPSMESAIPPAEVTTRGHQMLSRLPSTLLPTDTEEQFPGHQPADTDPSSGPLGEPQTRPRVVPDETPLPKKKGKNWVERFFKGLGKAYQQWQPGEGSGGLFGLGASVLGGGIGSAVSPGVYQGLEQESHRRNYFKDLQMQNAQAATDLNVAKAQNAQLDPVFKQQQAQIQREAEQGRNDRQQEQIRQTALRDQIKYEHDREIGLEKERRAAGEWKLDTNPANGFVNKIFPKDPNRAPEPFLDENGKQVVDPNYKRYNVTMSDGQTVSVTGSQALNADATRASATDTAARFNAGQQNEADRFNAAEKEREARDNRARDAETIELVGKANEAHTIAQAAKAQLEQLESSVQADARSGIAESGQATSQRAQLQKTIRENEATRDRLYFQAQHLPPVAPARAYKAQTYQSAAKPGKPVPAAKDPAGLYQRP